MKYRKTWQDQLSTFNQVKQNAKSVYDNLDSQPNKNSDFFHGEWDFINSMISSELFPVPKEEFLTIKHVGGTMFVDAWGDWFTAQFDFLRSKLDHRDLIYCMYEDYAGGAHQKYRLVDGVATSHNCIHHMYHIAKYQDTTGKNIGDANTIVEWGGGYGNLAKLITRLTGEKTYILVDSPTILTIQWLYLCSVFSPDQVNVVTMDSPKIISGKFNLLPTSCIELLSDQDVDMFISTWALSESAQKAKDFVIEEDFFGAESVLVALHHDVSKFTGSSTLIDAISSTGGKVTDISCMPDGHSYLFR